MTELIQKNVILADHSYMKIGGPAKYFFEFYNLDELRQGMGGWKKILSNNPDQVDKRFVIGDGTNILFSDDGYDGIILCNSISGIENIGNSQLEIGAGVSIKEINEYCIDNSLDGFSWSGGLPGTVGGAVFGNAGAFGGETKDSVVSVKSYDPETDKIIERTDLECKFGYRQSIFKTEQQDEVILSVIIQLQPGNAREIAGEVKHHIDYRESRQPLDFPSLGSTFKNIKVDLAPTETIKLASDQIKTDPFPVIPIAYLISLTNLTGTRVGGAEISTKHPNFIINTGGATAADVKKIIATVQTRIKSEFGVTPEPEIRELD